MPQNIPVAEPRPDDILIENMGMPKCLFKHVKNKLEK